MARAAERSVEPGQTVNSSAIWVEVRNLGLNILSSRGKDIEVLAWLMEAQLRLEGFAGLRDVYQVTLSLLEHYFDDLHSIGDDDPEERFAPLAGLNGIGSEGTLIQAIRLTPLTPNAKFSQFSLWDFQVSQRPGEERAREALQQAAADVGQSAMVEHLGAVRDCISLFDRLTELLIERCGAQAPPSSNIRNALVEAANAIRYLARIEEEPLGLLLPANPTPEQSIVLPEQKQTAAVPPRVDAIRSRDDAFEVLLGVARYFRKTEPHSPISMSIETLVRRGRMDFSQLLAELLPDAAQRQAVLTAAGIRPNLDA